MKYLVLSDSHGNVGNMVRAVELVKPHGIIHLGDGWRDAEETAGATPRNCVSFSPACRLSRCPATATSGALKRSSAC